MLISKEILTILSNGICEDNKFYLPPKQLDSKTYGSVNKILQEIGGKWNRKERAHIFSENIDDVIENLIICGEINFKKKTFDFFPTPLPLVEQMLDVAELKTGMHVLEPQAGQGNIAFACLQRGCIVDCVELEQYNFSILQQKMPKNSFIVHGDFLQINTNIKYDRIIMNPPFSKQQDIKHVNYALQFLKENGIIVSIMSAGVTFRSNKLTTDFRKLVETKGGYIENLPEKTFKESGTMISSVLVKLPN